MGEPGKVERIDVKKGGLFSPSRYMLRHTPGEPTMEIDMVGVDSWSRKKRLSQTTPNAREITHALAIHQAIEQLQFEPNTAAISFMANFNHVGFTHAEEEAGGNNVDNLARVYARVMSKAPKP